MNTKQESSEPPSNSTESPGNSDAADPLQDTKQEIVSANLRALEPVYFTAMLEEAQLFNVVNRLVAMFSEGTLPIGHARAGALLYLRWKGAHGGLTTAQRRNVYARTFGLPSGVDLANPNTEFTDLWLRFVSIVGMYSAELQSLPPGDRSVGPEEVLASGRDLAINLSAFGHGLAWFAARDFKSELQHITELLSDAELQSAFGARNPWELICRVAVSELGARPNVPRAHTRAQSGVIIIRWLSNRRARLLRPRTANILRHEDIVEGRTAASQNKKATLYPTDADLVTACEQWLGVTGTQEAELPMRESPAPPAELPTAEENPGIPSPEEQPLDKFSAAI